MLSFKLHVKYINTHICDTYVKTYQKSFKTKRVKSYHLLYVDRVNVPEESTFRIEVYTLQYYYTCIYLLYTYITLLQDYYIIYM